MKKVLFISFILLIVFSYYGQAQTITVPIAIEYNNFKSAVGKQIYDSGVYVINKGMGVNIIRQKKDSIFVFSLRSGPGITIAYGADSTEILITNTGINPVAGNIRLVTAITGSILPSDDVVIYEGLGAGTFTMQNGSSFFKPVRITNNSIYTLKVGVWTIPPKQWREWVFINSKWVQIQSGALL